jgi:adenylate cyclase
MKGLATATNVLEMNPFESLQDWNRHLIEKVGQQIDLIERMSRLKRYLSPQIAETIVNSDDANLFESHRREITAIFLDLRGFTAFSDGAEPEEVMALLKNYHTEMGKLILKFDGTLEHFAGDGMMVFFNDPIPCEDHAEKAVRMSLEMRDRAKELRIRWLKKGYNLDLGIGFAAGYAAVGNIGFEGRMDYGAVGKVTNLAARLCGEAKAGQILTNQKTLSKIENLVEAEPLEELQLKGFTRPVRAFNIVNLKSNEKAQNTFIRGSVPASAPPH